MCTPCQDNLWPFQEVKTHWKIAQRHPPMNGIKTKQKYALLPQMDSFLSCLVILLQGIVLWAISGPKSRAYVHWCGV